ncbi:MAG TPA: peptide-methionine (S)-S-oxide reductase MsrA [Hellea balneolensis]|uniref:Peptide methionine sulfoxide reductase MsrA n=1 Tax=Hellea balneolensis TaxID=287478 RepID=A0A7C5LZ32_9PROT|nr:peptide-methionine (S)-S-oxide reductase MsrA [Hellea balneolensis]
MSMNANHYVNKRPFSGPFPHGLESIILGMGCFWGAERLFWNTGGVYVTAVGYAGGHTKNPSYQHVCSGRSGHAEVVKTVFAPDVLPLKELLKLFFENHDPTQGDRQGNDIGSQYRSVIFTTTPEQFDTAQHIKQKYAEAYLSAGRNPITTEINMAPDFYLAEDYHQQYLAKNPAGYCGLKGTGISCAL